MHALVLKNMCQVLSPCMESQSSHHVDITYTLYKYYACKCCVV